MIIKIKSWKKSLKWEGRDILNNRVVYNKAHIHYGYKHIKFMYKH